MPDNCVDSVVVDPPYGLKFMGKHWDYDVPKAEVWAEVLRVLKPGGYLLSFFGTRTYHRGVIAIEDAGFEIRDQIGWCYSSGFPKSHDISKGIDKQAGHWRGKAGAVISDNAAMSAPNYERTDKGEPITAAAAAWKGWGTALKPAWEPICVARKHISEATVAANVLKWGTGGINIDGCRIGTEELTYGPMKQHMEARPWSDAQEKGERDKPAPKTVTGRWPANVIHDGSAEVLAGFPYNKSTIHEGNRGIGGIWGPSSGGPCGPTYNDSGSAARFFYTAKASKWDRNEDCENLEVKQSCGGGGMNNPECAGAYGSVKAKANNHHPTVKPTDLMQYLCRLVTPPNGIILDPYSGSGSTGKAALLECFRFIGFERDAEYCVIANERMRFIKGQGKFF